jgi:hypothetical protein
MTTEDQGIDHAGVPFVARFAERLDEAPLRTLRYDPQRQVSQVLVEGRWVDTLEAHLKTQPPGTRVTRVGGETTDDQ